MCRYNFLKARKSIFLEHQQLLNPLSKDELHGNQLNIPCALGICDMFDNFNNFTWLKKTPAERYKESLGAMEEDEMNEENCATYHLVSQL